MNEAVVGLMVSSAVKGQTIFARKLATRIVTVKAGENLKWRSRLSDRVAESVSRAIKHSRFTSAMTQYLPPNLLALFAPREPIPYFAPLDKLPWEKKPWLYTGVSQCLGEFEVGGGRTEQIDHLFVLNLYNYIRCLPLSCSSLFPPLSPLSGP